MKEAYEYNNPDDAREAYKEVGSLLGHLRAKYDERLEGTDNTTPNPQRAGYVQALLDISTHLTRALELPRFNVRVSGDIEIRAKSLERAEEIAENLYVQVREAEAVLEDDEDIDPYPDIDYDVQER